jgi:hypothetical protein
MTNEITTRLRAAETELEHAMDVLIDEANTARRNDEWSADLETEHRKALETMRTAWDAVWKAYRMVAPRPAAQPHRPWPRALEEKDATTRRRPQGCHDCGRRTNR